MSEQGMSVCKFAGYIHSKTNCSIYIDTLIRLGSYENAS
jgi:hypothetical protein